ncbi:hypothetical protein Leryth_011258, partial [Lithospermum erythrorhizon]
MQSVTSQAVVIGVSCRLVCTMSSSFTTCLDYCISYLFISGSNFHSK